MKRRHGKGCKRTSARSKRRRPLDLQQHNTALLAQAVTPPLPDLGELTTWRETYRELRAAALDLSNDFMEHLAPDALYWTASDLGVLYGGAVIVRGESDENTLADHAVYQHRVAGRNVVERLWERRQPTGDRPHVQWHRAALTARFTLLLLEEPIVGFGVWCRDILSGERLLLADISMSRSSPQGLTMAARLLRFGPYVATSGTSLPISEPSTFEAIGRYLARVCGGAGQMAHLSDERRGHLETFVLRTLLHTTSRIQINHVASPA